MFVRKNLAVEKYPPEHKSKMALLRYFEKYMLTRLYGEYDYTYQDMERTTGMEFVYKYYRTKHGIAFLMSHDVIQVRAPKTHLEQWLIFFPTQFNFNDHTKMVLSNGGRSIGVIDHAYKFTQYTLSGIMARARAPGASQDAGLQGILRKLQFLSTALHDASIGQQAPSRPASRAAEH
jgi:hypothetical protein